MKLTFLGIITTLSLLLMSCSPSIVRNMIKTYPPVAENEPVSVFTEKGDIPLDIEILGKVSVKDAGASIDCDYYSTLEVLKTETRNAGGSGIYLSEVIPPSPKSTCYQMTGILLRDNTLYHQDSIFIDVPQTGGIKNFHQLPKIKVSLNAGYGKRLGKIFDGLDYQLYNHMRKLSSGMSLDVSFDYYFNDFVGIGLIYSTYRASATDYMEYMPPLESGDYNTKDAIDFIGPLVVMRMNKGGRFFTNLKTGIGYMQYTSRQRFLADEITLTGRTLGLAFGLGFEYRITKVFGLALGSNIMLGSVSRFDVHENGKTKIKQLSDNMRETLANVDVSLGVRFYFN